MRAGRLRHRISIYSVSKLPGVSNNTETLFGTFACDVRPQTGKEIQALGSTFSAVTVKITMRYYRGIVPSMVAYFDNDRRKKYSIISITNVDEMNRELQIVATESK
jgi:head-tail adaptor